jgi:hypothetical protein
VVSCFHPTVPTCSPVPVTPDDADGKSGDDGALAQRPLDPCRASDRNQSTRRWIQIPIMLAILASIAPVRADSAWRAGLDLHGFDAAFGARRPIGIGMGIRCGAVEGAVVVDPMIFVLGWEMLDVTVGRWLAHDRVEALIGWRQTSGAIGTGRRYDEAMLLGADWRVPSSGKLRLTFGVELETSLWRHGGRIDGEHISFSSSSADLLPRLELLLHARLDLTVLL